jgi:hypothetical protein
MLVSKARIAAMCFYDQTKLQLPNEQERLGIIKGMETLLDSNKFSGRSFLSVPYSLNANPLKMRALLAL